MFARAESELQGLEPIDSFIINSADPNPVEILLTLSNVDERPPNKECSAGRDQD
jgi:hypothetical protein